MGGRAEHWDIVRRQITIDGFLRANAARQGKVDQKAALTTAAPLPMRFDDMTEADIWREAEARGMLHSQIRRRTGE